MLFLTLVISSATLTIIGILAAVILGTAVLSTGILVKKWWVGMIEWMNFVPLIGSCPQYLAPIGRLWLSALSRNGEKQQCQYANIFEPIWQHFHNGALVLLLTFASQLPKLSWIKMKMCYIQFVPLLLKTNGSQKKLKIENSRRAFFCHYQREFFSIFNFEKKGIVKLFYKTID